MKIENVVNLTQHIATQDQVANGVVNLPDATRKELARLLTFDSCPDREDILARATAIAEIAWLSGYSAAMIGGAPYLMAALEAALKERGITPLYAFSVRTSCEEPDGEGGVRKVTTFRHAGFVQA